MNKDILLQLRELSTSTTADIHDYFSAVYGALTKLWRIS